jgi:ribosomal protein S12 methylthiotransferase accessory factor YcaO
MKQLYKYRYAASLYFRKTSGKTPDKKMALKKALIELLNSETDETNIREFFANDHQEEKKVESEGDFSQEQTRYSNIDIPRQAQTKRKNYDELMRVIEEFFKKEKLLHIFLKLRAYIKKQFDNQ